MQATIEKRNGGYYGYWNCGQGDDMDFLSGRKLTADTAEMYDIGLLTAEEALRRDRI